MGSIQSLSHLLLNCVHKGTDIYDGTGLLALKEVVVVERGTTSNPSLSIPVSF